MPGKLESSVPPPSLNSESTTFAGQLYVPKPSIGQALVWLVLVVVLIGLDFGMSAIETREIKPLLHGAVATSWWTIMVSRFSFAFFAACLVTSGILIHSRCFRMLGRLQPGHWIVLISATGGILRRVAEPFNLLKFTYHSPHGWAQYTSEAVTWFNILAVGLLFAFAAIRLRDAKRWKVLLASGSASALFWAIPLMAFSMRVGSAVAQFFVWSMPCWSAIILVIAVAAVVIDWPRRATRDWIHWLGALLWTLGSLAACIDAMMVAWRWAGH
jgi:hypothetical protein